MLDQSFASTYFSFSDSARRVQRLVGAAWAQARRTVVLPSSGKLYLEAVWEADGGTGLRAIFGVCPSPPTATQYPGQQSLGYGYGNTGSKYTAAAATSYGTAWSVGDVIGLALEIGAGNTGKIWWSRNGTWQNSGNPAAGTGAAWSNIALGGDTVSVGAYSTGNTLSINETNCRLVYDPPSGFSPIASAKCPYEHAADVPVRLTVEQQQIVAQALVVAISHLQTIAPAALVKLGHDQVVPVAKLLQLSFAEQLQAMAGLGVSFNQLVVGFAGGLAIDYSQLIEAAGYNLASVEHAQRVVAGTASSAQLIELSVSIAGVEVVVESCDLVRSGFAISADLLLRRKADWQNKQIGDAVVVQLLGETYDLLLEQLEVSESYTVGGVELECRAHCVSQTVQLIADTQPELASPLITKVWPSGTLASEVLNELTSGVCSCTVGFPDFPLGELAAVEEDKLAIIRKIYPDPEWSIETSPAGVLTISKFFADVDPFALPEPAGETAYSSVSLAIETTPIVTTAVITNYSDDGRNGLTLDVDESAREIYGYAVPWTADTVLTSSADSGLEIYGGEVEELQIVEVVEFVDGKSQVGKPIYGNPTVRWLDLDLGPVAHQESGELVASAGNSAAEVTYTTRRRRWQYSNSRVEAAQIVYSYKTD